MILTLLPSSLYILANIERQEFWIPTPNDKFFLELFELYFGGLSLSMIFAALLVVGLGRLMVDESKKEVFWFFMVWVMACTVIPYVRSIYFQSVLTMRNMIILLPAVLLLLAYAIGLSKSRKAQGCLGVIVLCFSMTPLYTEYQPVYTLENQLKPKSQLRQAVEFMAHGCVGCRIYAMGDEYFEVYFKLLGYSLKVYSVDKMKDDFVSGNRPVVFYVATTRRDWSPGDSYMREYNFRLIEEDIIGDTPIRKYEALPVIK